MSANLHHDMVMENYYAAAYAWEAEAERVALGYETETNEYAQTHPCPQFKDFLILHSHKGQQ